jgi:hypothetical protein
MLRFPRRLTESVFAPWSSVVSVMSSSLHLQFPWLFLCPLSL